MLKTKRENIGTLQSRYSFKDVHLIGLCAFGLRLIVRNGF